MAKRLPGVLPGEQYKGKSPFKGKRPRPKTPNAPKPKPPMSDDPAPTSYADLKSAFRTKGKQPGEKAAIGRIAANRGVSRDEAREIAIRRTGKGLSIKGSVGPNAKPPIGRDSVPTPMPGPKVPKSGAIPVGAPNAASGPKSPQNMAKAKGMLKKGTK